MADLKAKLPRLKSIIAGEGVSGIDKARAALRAMLDLDNDEIRDDAERCENSLYQFIKSGWHVLEPGNPFVDGWHIGCVAEHLQAVTRFEITKLVINLPPRHCKSMSKAMWCCQSWAKDPTTRWIDASYAASLSEQDQRRCRRVMTSEWYQARWGNRFQITRDKLDLMENSQEGWRLATSVGGLGGGKGAEYVIGDDLHKIKDAHSQAAKVGVWDFWDNTLSTRWNNPERFARVIIMHRIAEDDLTGHVISVDRGYEHLVIPAEYEPTRYFFGVGQRPRDSIVPTSLQMKRLEWRDDVGGSGRKEQGDLLWPARISREKLDEMKNEFRSQGAGASGLLQQRPSPAEGDVFQRPYFRYFSVVYNHGLGKIVLGRQTEDGPPPVEVPLDRAIFFQTVDTALKQNQSAKFTAVVTFAAVNIGENGSTRRLLLVWDAWRARLAVPEQFEVLKAIREGRGVFNEKTRSWDLRCEDNHWPRRVIIQAVEEKASGIGLLQTAAAEGYALEALNEPGGKVERAAQVATLYKLGNVYHNEAMPSLVDFEDELLSFPSGAYADMTDCLAYGGIMYNRNRYLMKAMDSLFVFPNMEEAERFSRPEEHYRFGDRVITFPD